MPKKKPRSKKRYHPRAVAVSPYLAGLNIGESAVDHKENDRIFLLRVANQTADKGNLPFTVGSFKSPGSSHHKWRTPQCCVNACKAA